MSELGGKPGSPDQTDALLWLGGAIIVGLGATWLLLSKPWSDGRTAFETPAEASIRAVQETPAAPGANPGSASAESRQTPRAALESALEHDPLRMAQLAFEAGMLVEPEEFSAWTLYRRAQELDPDDSQAQRGLAMIADELLKRGGVAVDQGRFDDARAAIERVRSALPAHPGANDLAFRIAELTAEADASRAADTEDLDAVDEAPEPEVASSPPEQPAESPPEAPRVDPLLEPHASFVAAVADNRLLTPAGASARLFLNVMIELDPQHPLTVQARTQLSEELLSRANASIIALDAAAAETWLDEAERLAVDVDLVGDARARLRRRLIDAESARPVPVSALVSTHYVAPRFPARALERAFQGWVDLEFTVAKDGTPQDVTVTDASHNSYFQREAVEAVEAWRFEPRVFLGEAIEQRVYTRIRFTLD